MISAILPYITVISAAIMVLFILLQNRGTSLGAGFGSSGEFFTTRRGIEKSLFDATIVVSVIFILSILANLLIG